MSEPIDDGGPAFPGEQGHIPDGTWNQTWCSGMSLRDYFAAAMARNSMFIMGDAEQNKEMAEWVYVAADAMLAERKRGGAT